MLRVFLFILVHVFCGICFAQSTCSGVVVDTYNEPLIGVTIYNLSSKEGTVSDLDGKFRIQASKGDVLAFRMLGMEVQEVKYQGQSNLRVTLTEEASLIDEVVVTGFREVERKLFTGAAESLKMDDIKPQSINDVGRVLEGQVAGVSVDNVSGTFGTSPRIRIRGNASLNGNNQPLFVIDGVILEDLNSVNTDDLISGNANTLVGSSIANISPSDIETFQILKDASATAIYGARAANGVVVITTKKGKSGELRVNYSASFSMPIRPSYDQFDLLNSAEEMSVYRELSRKGIVDISTSVRSRNYGALGKMFTLIANHELEWGEGGGLNEDFLNPYENANTDWFDVLFQSGLQQQHSLSFTTGTEKSNNYYSISYLKDEGQTIADQVARLTASARNTYFLSDRFTFGLKLTASYRDQEAPGTRNRELDPLTGEFNRDFDINPYSYSLNTARSIRPYDENGDLEFFRRNYAPFNILHELDNNSMEINVLDVSAQTDFEFAFRDNLALRGVMQVRYASTERDHAITENSNQAEAFRANETQFIQDANNLLYSDPDNPGLNPVVVLPQGGFNYLDKSDLLNFFGRFSVDWNNTFKEQHEVSVLAGQEIRFTDRTESSATGLGVVYESGGIVVTDPNIIEFFNSQDISYYSLDQERDRFIGWFVNAGYAWKSRYVGNFTFRYDGSNQLGKLQQARFLPTWNVSGAWNAYNESFMANFPLKDLRFRATYGLSGNLPQNASALLNIQSDVTVRPTDVEPVLSIEDLTNTELTWEKLQELNLGVDFSMLNKRVQVNFDYYIRNSFDLIGNVQTSGVGGQGIKVGNFADMQIQGIDFSLNTTNIDRENFTWRTNFNVGFSQDKITRLDFGPQLFEAVDQSGAAVLNRPRRSLYSVNFAGLDGAGIPTFYDSNNDVVFEFDFQSRDNLEETLIYEGSVEPRTTGGFTNSIQYKGFNLSVLLSFKLGYKIRLNDAYKARYTDFDALPGELVNRWAVPGDEDITDIPAIMSNVLPTYINNGGDVFFIGDEWSNIENLTYSFYNKSTVRVANGDYVRLKTVRLSYQIPTTIVRRYGLQNLVFSAESLNLALLYSDRENLQGQDPEFISSGGVSLPQPTMVTFSINAGF